MLKHFISLQNLERETFERIISEGLLIKKKSIDVTRLLKDKNIGLIFEKQSTRTRVSLEVGIRQMGGQTVFLNSDDIQLSRGESIADTIRVLDRYLDGLVIRTGDHNKLIELEKWGAIPIINGLSNLFHPLQAVTDMMTIVENGFNKSKRAICFIGDSKNNVSRSLITGALLMEMKITLCSPANYFPNDEFLASLKGNRELITFESNPITAVQNAGVIYTDVWVSMGDEAEKEKRVADLTPYQINKKLMSNVPDDAIIMHCLPANKNEEITDEVFESIQSKVFDQAENRLHGLKSVLKYIYSPVVN